MSTRAIRWLWAGSLLALTVQADPVQADEGATYGRIATAPSKAQVTDDVHYGWRAASVGEAPVISDETRIVPPLFPLLFQHSSPDDPGRHVGLGEPLVGTSWLNRPYHIGWLVGGLFGDELIQGQVSQDDDIFGGYRLGWDFDHYWGTELRFAFGYPDLTYTAAPNLRQTSRDVFWDLNLVYYPWGDARWRPYFSAGLGIADFNFQTANRRRVQETVLAMPLGLGVKYRWKEWLAVRAGFTDNLSFGARSVDTMHNLSLTVGAELQFGGARKSYYPF